MSKIGRKVISIPQGVQVTIQAGQVEVKGPKGMLTTAIPAKITVAIEAGAVSVSRATDEKTVKALHGLIRSLLNNSIIGVTMGFSKTLKLVGTGYRAQAQGSGLQLAVGYSHPVTVAATTGITFKVENQDTIVVSGIDKHLVGQVSANIREIRPPEPYQGKGIRYDDEHVRRKQGKAAAK